MKGWLIFGTVAGGSLGVWLSFTAHGLDLVDGLAIGVVTGWISAIGLSSIPWRAMARKEW